MIRAFTALPSSLTNASNVAVYAFEKATRPAGAFLFGLSVDKAFGAARAEGFEGKAGQVSVITPADRRTARYFFIGMGPEADATLEDIRRGAALAVRRAAGLRVKQLDIRPPQLGSSAAVAQAAVEGAVLGSYRYTKYLSNPAPFALQSVSILAKDAAEQRAAGMGVKRGEIFAQAVCFARDLINQPPSDATPDVLAKVGRSVAKGPVSVRVYGKNEIKRLGMGALLGVNRGSALPPYFLHFVYKPRGKAARKIGICGKGITFDSGGLSLKPAASMETMKYDMSGAATVISIFRALPLLKPNVEVHGFAAITENMPGGDALKPGDVLHTVRGKTIEVLNTDAEGRLILADALSYACKQKLDEIIDIATLTGACVVALGTRIAGIMGNDSRLLSRLKSASSTAGEKLWELPLEKEYLPALKSSVADLKNIGNPGEAGTIIAGLFLQEFVDRGQAWAHLDIASTGWTKSPTALSETGATGVLIRTLLHHLLSYEAS